jgi:hypothetical protein
VLDGRTLFVQERHVKDVLHAIAHGGLDMPTR